MGIRVSRDDLSSQVPWFAALSAATQQWLLDRAEPITLRGGETLFVAGSESDALYLLGAGSLGAFAGDTGKVIGQVVAGETVGETGLITGRPRGATVRALRDSALLRLTRATFDELAQHQPEALRAIARIALDRASLPQAHARTHRGPRTLALLPQTEGVDARAIAATLAGALMRLGTVAVVSSADHDPDDIGWFNELEARHRFVIYVAGDNVDAWRELVLRQADALLFVAEARAQAAPWSELTRGVSAPLPRPEHFALVHAGKPRLGAARRWMKLRPSARLHHVRGAPDLERVARLVVGECLTLVLSGGGARGFAHLGVIKALREAGLVIDAVGGTSIGAIIGAGVAADWSHEEMVAVFRRSFVTTNPLSDRTIPFVSLVSGRKVSRLLREAFGERAIEDLVLPYFCVSADLTAGEVAVHRAGPLWQWLRASVAIPGVLPPVFHGGRVYVDGGVINNLPVDVMQQSQRGAVVAVDIGGDHAVSPGQGIEEFDLPPLPRMIFEWYTGRRRPSILQIMLRAGMVNSGAATLAARQAANLLIMPPLASIDLLEWQEFDRAIEIGYQHALRQIGGQKDALAAESPLMAF
jgi:NTE family protein